MHTCTRLCTHAFGHTCTYMCRLHEHTHAQTHAHKCTHEHTCTQCTDAHMYTYADAHKCTHVHVQTRASAPLYTHAHICVLAHTCTYTHAQACVQVHTCTHTGVQTHEHTRTHTCTCRHACKCTQQPPAQCIVFATCLDLWPHLGLEQRQLLPLCWRFLKTAPARAAAAAAPGLCRVRPGLVPTGAWDRRAAAGEPAPRCSQSREDGSARGVCFHTPLTLLPCSCF